MSVAGGFYSAEKKSGTFLQTLLLESKSIKAYMKLVVVCTWKPEAGGLPIGGQLGLHSETLSEKGKVWASCILVTGSTSALCFQGSIESI